MQDAKEAIKRLNNYEILPNRLLVVTKSVDNRRLWVNGIPKSKSVQEIRWGARPHFSPSAGDPGAWGGGG